MIKRNWPFLFTILVIAVDFLAYNGAFIAALYLRFPESWLLKDYADLWLVLNILFFPLTIGLGLYRDVFHNSLYRQEVDLKRFTFYLALITMSYLYLIKGHEFSRGVVLIFFMTQYMFLQISHWVLFKINSRLIRRGFGRRKVFIVGADESAVKFAEHLEQVFGKYFEISAFSHNGKIAEGAEIFSKVPLVKHQEADQYLENLEISQVFIVSDSMIENKYEHIRQLCDERHIPVKMVSPRVSQLMEQVKVRDITGVPLNTTTGRFKVAKWQRRAKRAFDLTVLAAAAPLLLPLGVVIALLVKLTSRGPVFFKQKRALYKGGKTFYFYKFRTMYENAEELKEKLLDKNETNGALFKMKDDPRVTPLGKYLRKYSLDEIPQFINVLKGEMSIVGPRPLPIKDFDMIKNGQMNYEWYKKRGLTLPGITGLWQISGRSKLSFEEMCMLDLYYIENQSLFFDFEILFETIPAVFQGRGAY